MFTGIVRARGEVKSIRQDSGQNGGGGCQLEVDLGEMAAAPIAAGDSIAVNGACLTVAELRGANATCAVFQVSPETLDTCLVGEWTVGDRLNLEPALTLQTPIGGHLVTGHIDAAGRLLARRPAADCARMKFAAPRAVGSLIAAKGSIAVDGVSLTVNAVSDHAGDRGGETHFEVMVVPHTLAETNLGALEEGARVHLEVDPLARYARRILEVVGAAGRGENCAGRDRHHGRGAAKNAGKNP